jgi:hypothetical protein
LPVEREASAADSSSPPCSFGGEATLEGEAGFGFAARAAGVFVPVDRVAIRVSFRCGVRPLSLSGHVAFLPIVLERERRLPVQGRRNCRRSP